MIVKKRTSHTGQWFDKRTSHTGQWFDKKEKEKKNKNKEGVEGITEAYDLSSF